MVGEENPKLKGDLDKLAASYRKLATERSKKLGLPLRRKFRPYWVACAIRSALRLVIAPAWTAFLPQWGDLDLFLLYTALTATPV